jgi:hypothetical protein
MQALPPGQDIVTPQAVAQSARLPLMMTHAPGHMFITDLKADRLADAGIGS